MPNHVTNELTAPKHVIDSLRGSRNGEDAEVDFNTVVPMPEVMEGDCGMHIGDWAKLAMGFYPLSFFQKRHPNPADSAKQQNWGAAADALHVGNVLSLLEKGPYPKDFSNSDFAMFLKRIQALKQYGEVDWHEWSCKSWGTKWNAYSINRVSDTVVRFDTAWSAPLPLLDALSRKFPDDVLRLRWSDEDFGRNVGNVEVQNGNVLSGGRLENYSRAAWALVLELHFDGVVPDDMEQRSDGSLRYKDEEVET